MQRVLALYIPFLSTDRLRAQAEGVGKCRFSQVPDRPSTIDHREFHSPVATIAPHGQTIRIVHVNEAARQSYVRPGQTLAEAKAVVPELLTYSDDPAADRRQIESLALWAQCFSPVVHMEGSDTLLLDVTGCERLFRGEDNLVRQAVAGLMDRGFTARGAIADTPGAAWAVAHAHSEPMVITQPGMHVVYLAPLAVAALRIDPKQAEALIAVGVETIGSLLHLPRSSLTSRFGQSLLERLDQALGDLPEILRPYQPKAAMTHRLEFGGTTDRVEVLLEAVRQATGRFCEQLNRQTAGVRQLFVTFDCPNVPTAGGTQTRRVTVEVGLSNPTRSASHLLRLLTVKLEGLRLPAPAESLTVWARQFEALDDPQVELFESGLQDAKDLSDLIDRLAARLGTGAILRSRVVMDYQPERAFEYVSVVTVKRPKKGSKRSRERGIKTSRDQGREGTRDQGGGGSPCQIATLPHYPIIDPSARTDFTTLRPLMLFENPLRIAAISIVPDGPPIAFRIHGRQHPIAECVGPERIETGWWRGEHIRRDYYRVVTGAGRHGWIFRARETGQWFLHGWFD